MGEDKVSDCFPLNGNSSDPFIFGLDNIVKTYKERLPEIGIGKIANFSSIFKTFKNYVEKDIVGQNAYAVLLLLTDGDIDDMK